MSDNMVMQCAVVFPGQGSQEPGMGRDLAETSKEVMELWKKAESITGEALREIYWDGDEKAMAETRYLQPALTVVNVGFWMQTAAKLRARHAGLCLAGHSLGEFSAIAAAEVLPVTQVLELVALRGRLMADADPEGVGAMAAVLKLELGAVQEIVESVRNSTGMELGVANYNSPAQYVVSGKQEAVEAVEPLVKERKGRAIRLAVSGAFHSPFMREAAAELAGSMDKLSWSNARHPVFLNTTAMGTEDGSVIKKEMARQMTSSVRWIEIISNQWGSGVRQWYELGPKQVLTRLLSANLKDVVGETPWKAQCIGNVEQLASLDDQAE